MIRLLLYLAILMQFLTACETDVDIIAYADPTPVAYCVLDQEKSVQYLRLSKSYISFDAGIPPEVPDSILFPENTQAVLEEVSAEKVIRVIPFEPFEIKKDSGFFPHTVHWIYQAETQVQAGWEYRLIVYVDQSDRIVYATTMAVSPFEIINPKYPQVRYIHLQTDHNPVFNWTKSRDAGIYQFGFIVHYDETIGLTTIRKSLPIYLYSFFAIESVGQYYGSSMNSNQFYIAMHDLVGSNPEALRTLINVDAFVVAGGEELAHLVSLQTGGQTFSLMEYSNIFNGTGVFSSRMTRTIEGFRLTDQTLDSLAYGQYTYELNFTDRTGSRKGGGL